MSTFRLRIPDAASEAALPPVPTGLLALSGPALGAALSQYAAQAGHAGGLGAHPLLPADDLTAHGPALRAVVVRAC